MSIQSPILALKNSIAEAAFRIAPEKEKELIELRDKYDISLTLNEGDGFSVKVDPSICEIKITIATLEYLWASSYNHLILCSECIKLEQSGVKQFDIGRNSKSRDAHDLLNWSINNLACTYSVPWPSHMPQPQQYPQKSSEVYSVNELFFCVVAWIIHHEIAHINLNHQLSVSTNPIGEEKEADIAATRWVLGDSNVYQKATKQTLGIVAAILALQGIEEPFRFSTNQSHPRAFERIDYCLTEAGVAENDKVYLFAATIMQIQLAYKRIEISPDWTTFKELFSEYLFEIAGK